MKLSAASLIALVAAMSAATGNSAESSMACASACKYLSKICPKRCMEYINTEGESLSEREMNGVTIRTTLKSIHDNLNLLEVLGNLQTSVNNFPEYNKTIDIKIEWNSIDKNLVIKKETFYHNVSENMIVNPHSKLYSPVLNLNKNVKITEDETEDSTNTLERPHSEQIDSPSNLRNLYFTDDSEENLKLNAALKSSEYPSLSNLDDSSTHEENEYEVLDKDYLGALLENRNDDAESSLEREERHSENLEREERHTENLEREERHTENLEREERHTENLEGEERHTENLEGEERHTKNLEGEERHTKNLERDERHTKTLERMERDAKINWPWRDPAANCPKGYDFFPYCPETWKMFGYSFHPNCEPEPIPGIFLYPHPRWCNSYFVMIDPSTDNYKFELRQCKAGLIFDDSRGQCRLPQKVQNPTCDPEFPCIKP